ncbi:MAG: 50S ribosomal protein L10 [Candidatus Izemoplasmatales bacterium]|jgi:large subunit ribosomal protein L10|nr:50S ribosomal protein L10 [Candidatus Izemoplasmatales bacterium]MDD5294202.1 50S ribosomal protein L10 [Candidatus Izemoplasmatales bacterium]
MSRETVIQAKQESVNQVQEMMAKAKAVVLAEYRGLTVEKTEMLRRLLRKEGCEMVVIKNNIARRAAKIAGYAALENDFNGPNGVVFAYNDSVAGAKILHEFARKNPKLVIKSGVVDGDFYEPADIRQIATLPPKDTLLAMLATQLYAPLRDLAIGLDLLTQKD